MDRGWWGPITPRKQSARERAAKASAATMDDDYFGGYGREPPPTADLSTWGEAIIAAATGDAAKMRGLLAGDLDDGAGVNLRTFRTSREDVRFILDARNLVIDANQQLVEIAVERDHFDVVCAQGSQPDEGGQTPTRADSTLTGRKVIALTEPELPKSKEVVDGKPVPPRVARSVSTFVQPRCVHPSLPVSPPHATCRARAYIGNSDAARACSPCMQAVCMRPSGAAADAHVSALASRLADEVRDHLASRLECLTSGPAAGLAVLRLPPESRQTFFLPREVMALPLEGRRVAIGALLEDACTPPHAHRLSRPHTILTAIPSPPHPPHPLIPSSPHTLTPSHPHTLACV
jgi:hypothetical protein